MRRWSKWVCSGTTRVNRQEGSPQHQTRQCFLSFSQVIGKGTWIFLRRNSKKIGAGGQEEDAGGY